MCQLSPRFQAEKEAYSNRIDKSQVRALRILIFIIFVGVTAGTACGQPATSELKGNDEISIDFKHPAKRGETKKYFIKLGDIPNAPAISNRYKLLHDKTYYLSTDVIDLGTPTVTFFQVPVINEEEFKKVRVLRLIPEEFMHGGWEWKDCTISLETTRSQFIDKSSAEYLESEREFKEVYGKYLPDYSQRRVACDFDAHGLAQKEYFALVVQTREPPSKPLTELKLTLDDERHDRTGNAFTYKVIFKNTGAADIGALDFRASFDIEANLTTVRPERGRCKRSAGGNKQRAFICYIDILKAGESVSVEFYGEPSGLSRDETRGKFRPRWIVNGFMRERPGDPSFMVNYFIFDSIELFASR